MRIMKQRRTIFALPSWQNISAVYLFAHAQNIYLTWPTHAQDEAEEDDIRSAFTAEYLKSSSLGSEDSVTGTANIRSGTGSSCYKKQM